MKQTAYLLFLSCVLFAACESGDVEAVFTSEKMALEKKLKAERKTRIRLQSYIDSVMRKDTIAVMERVRNYENNIMDTPAESDMSMRDDTRRSVAQPVRGPSFIQAKNRIDRWVASQAPPSTKLRVPTSGRIVLAFQEKALFEADRISISPKGKKILISLSQIFTSQKIEHLTVEAHVDSLSASKAGTWAAGWQRAKSIGDVLIETGFPIKKLALASHGSSSPVAPNSQEAGRYLNRRTLLILEVQ